MAEEDQAPALEIGAAWIAADNPLLPALSAASIRRSLAEDAAEERAAEARRTERADHYATLAAVGLARFRTTREILGDARMMAEREDRADARRQQREQADEIIAEPPTRLSAFATPDAQQRNRRAELREQARRARMALARRRRP